MHQASLVHGFRTGEPTAAAQLRNEITLLGKWKSNALQRYAKLFATHLTGFIWLRAKHWTTGC